MTGITNATQTQMHSISISSPTSPHHETPKASNAQLDNDVDVDVDMNVNDDVNGHHNPHLKLDTQLSDRKSVV